MTGVEIRAATVADVPAMRALGVRTWWATYAGVLPEAVVERGIGEFWSEYSLGAAARSGRMLVAVRDRAVVGLLESDRLDDARAAIWKLYVAPETQRAGIGRALLEHYTASAGTAEVRVEHDERNTVAGAFFDRLGFAVDEVDEADGVRTVRRARRLSRARARR